MSIVVGINADVIDDEKPRQSLYLDYLDWITAGGGVPLILPSQDSSLDLLDRVDAVLLTGGDDYRAGNPAEEPAGFVPVADRRETFDLRLAREVVRRDVPVFAICGGFQLLVLVCGGTIYGDLETEHPAAESLVSHRRGAS